MKMTKKYKHICSVLGLSLVCGAGMLNATSGSKTVQATYRDINITYNGQQKVVTDEKGNTIEPFAINGTVYVPLRGVSNILGVSADWNGSTNSVILTGNTTPQADYSAYIAKINELQTKLNTANAELAALKNNNSSNNNNTTSEITTAALNKLAQELYSEYSNELKDSIDMSFELTQKASRIQVAMTYSSSKENTVFDDLSQTTIKKYIQSICDEIQDEFGEVAIQGDITYEKSDMQKVNFSVSTSGKYSYEFALDDESVEDVIEDVTNGYISLGGIGKVDIDEVEVTIKNNKIEFIIHLDASNKSLKNDSDTTKDWNTIKKTSLVKSQLKDIVSEITENAYNDYTITGSIVTSDGSEIAEIDSDGDINVSGI